MWQWIGLMLVALLLPAAPAAAQDRLDAAVAALDRATAQPKAEAAAVERMAGLLRMAPETVRVQHASTRLGWGDFFMAQRIATRGGHPVEKVFAARRSGAAWDEIAAEARVDADLLVQDVAAVWPDAATPKDEPKGIGARVRDLFGGTPAPSPGDRAPDRTQEEIRDQMIRGGGRPR
ncbi:MAG: hypothetical protein DMD78_19280 [Candidatus Rokuibacteriota bacterium]|nr:MAG: hypothetical protein DMD78_19280 [Candidatus Rokubacteria bacterium]